MPINCKQCGAPLAPPPNATFVTCAFCKATNDLRQPVNLHVHVHGPQAPGGFQPARAPNAPGGGGATSAVPVLAAVMGVAVMGVVGAVVAFGASSAGSGGSVSGSGIPGLGGGPASWGAVSPGCLVDANGDGVFDVAGMSGPPGGAGHPTIVDGQSGKVIFQGPDLGYMSKLVCPSTEWFLVGKEDFELQLYNARKPDPPNRLRGSDKLRLASMGKDCIAVRTEDDGELGIKLPAGTTGECKADLPKYPGFDKPGIIGLTGESTSLSVNGKDVTLSKQRSGSGTLTLTVAQGGKQLFEKRLPYIAPTFSTGLALAGDKIVITAARPGAKDKSILVGFDMNGNELYNKPLVGQVTHSVGLMTFNGRWVIASYWTYLRAFDPATGNEVWSIGG